MAGRLSYSDWLNLMADACGMPRAEFEGLTALDRRELLAAASGMTWEAFSALRDSVAQVEAIRRQTKPPPPKGETGNSAEATAGKQGPEKGKVSEAPTAKTDKGEGQPTEADEGEGDGDGEPIGGLDLPQSGDPSEMEFEPQFLSEETREAITNAIRHAHGAGVEYTQRVAMKLAESLEKRLVDEVAKLKAQYVGRNQLDAATLDRFAVVEVDYDVDYEAKVGDKDICQWLWAIRKKTLAAKLRRAVSTRAIERCTMMKAAGVVQPEIAETFFASWTKDEMAKVGG